MKILGRIVLFVLTFILGSQIVPLVSWGWPEIPDIVVDGRIAGLEPEKAAKSEGIRVMYAGEVLASGEETAYLRFIVYNGTSVKITYGSQSPELPTPSIRINGNKLPGHVRCGSGASFYFIEPGDSAEFLVGAYEFEKVPKKSDLISVAFRLRDANSHFYFGDTNPIFPEELYSEPFVLPDSFRQAIRQWQTEPAKFLAEY